MHLSSLLIDVGDNPDRPRPGRLWLRNLYHVHQRLCMAFPSDPRKQRDPEFVAPYDPCDFPEQRHFADKSKKKSEAGSHILAIVHAPRNQDSGFLFRVDPLPGGQAVILVQSAVRPNWDYAFHNAEHLLAAPPQVKSYDPIFTEGKSYRFRLAANPTKRLSERSSEADGQTIDKWQNKGGKGKRVPVPTATEIEAWRIKNPKKDARIFIDSKLFDWLARRAEPAGFAVQQESTLIQPGYIYVKKGRDGNGQRLRTVRFDGVLRVTNPEALRNTVIRGLGPGKAFGCGLLSTAPCQDAINLNPCEAI
jgi:CRISPR system Cascade subunit CasE